MSGSVADNAGRASGVIAAAGVGGKLLAMETVTNSTRTATPATGSAGVVTSLLSASYTKTSATSDLIVECLVPLWDDNAGAMDIGLYDGTTFFTGIWCYNPTNNIRFSHTVANFGTLSAASHTISWAYRSGSGGSVPNSYANPNATDEGRFTQQHTTFVFSEVEA
jgi:hypothetical protein